MELEILWDLFEKFIDVFSLFHRLKYCFEDLFEIVSKRRRDESLLESWIQVSLFKKIYLLEKLGDSGNKLLVEIAITNK